MKKSIGVIGQGFVGGSLTTVMSERGFDVYVHDKTGKVVDGGIDLMKPSAIELDVRRTRELAGVPNKREPGEKTPIQYFVDACEEIKGFSGVYFVCVPTPMFEDGECDTSIVSGVLNELSSMPHNRIAVVKSTVPPGSIEKWNKEFEATGLRIIFSPEFLTETNALNDMRFQNRIILGGPRPYINAVKLIFQKAFPGIPLIKTSSTTAEMVKYFTNVQLAARVILSCEMSQICEALDKKGMNIDYDKMLEYAKYDNRLGGTHMNVPGPDGIMGSRGHCFPKDMNALIFVAKKLGVKPIVMNALWEKNLEVVPEEHRDWEKMSGRAVSKRKK